MRFFFLAKEKKRFSQQKQVLRAFFFALSLSLFLSLSLSLFVHVIFEGRRERDCFSAAVLLLQLLSSRCSRLRPRVSLLFLFSFVVCLRVSFKRK